MGEGERGLEFFIHIYSKKCKFRKKIGTKSHTKNLEVSLNYIIQNTTIFPENFKGECTTTTTTTFTPNSQQ